MNFETPFIDRINRLRSGWRFAIFITGFLVVQAFVGLFGMLFYGKLDERSGLFLNGAISLIPAVLIGWLCGKYFDRVPFKALGTSFTNRWLTHFFGGLLAGALTISFAVYVAIVFGGLKLVPNDSYSQDQILTSILTSFLVLAVAAAFEEVLFRGYFLQTFNRSGLAWVAILLTSVFFGLLHIGNPNAGIISTANTILAGIWFAVAYLKTRDLWFVWGMHWMWNWFQGSVFGIEISGLTDLSTASIFKEIDAGPTWLTGENYGIEGGVAATAALLISTLAIQFLPLLKAAPEMVALTDPPIEI